MSNGCATSPSVRTRSAVPRIILILWAILLTAGLARAQQPVTPPETPGATSEHRATSALKFLGGGALALAAHEGGHLLFNGIFDANPRVKKVSFHGIPFFAITHDAGLSPRREFVISSAGFWVQEATNEVILTRRERPLSRVMAPVAPVVPAVQVESRIQWPGCSGLLDQSAYLRVSVFLRAWLPTDKR